MMNKNLRKTLILLVPALFCSCSKNTLKTITIDEGSSILKTALAKDDADPLKWTSYCFKSTITAPKELQSDLPYLSLFVTYQSTPAYLTTIHRVTSTGDDTYAITKSTSDQNQVSYSVTLNGGDPSPYDPVKHAYIYNFFELPDYLLDENIYGLQRAVSLLSLVQGGNENKLTSYNLATRGDGNLDMTLRGNTLDFSQLFTETPQINTNVSSIRFAIDSYLVQSLQANYLVLPASTPSVSSSSSSSKPSSIQGAIKTTSSTNGTPCSITMGFGYGVTSL